MSERIASVIRALLSIALVSMLLVFAVETWHWPLVGDAPLMHYVVFMMEHGRVPYRDIIDPNLPETYLVQKFVIHHLGAGALAWRIFDFSLLAASGASIMAICLPYDWFAGLFAASLFALIHGRDGLANTGQRDLVMTAFLLAGVAFLFSSYRGAKPPWLKLPLLLTFGVCLGTAAMIKPVMLLCAPLIFYLSLPFAKKNITTSSSHLVAAAAGVLLPFALTLATVLRWGVLGSLLENIRWLIPALRTTGQRSLPHLLWHSIPGFLLPLLLLWLPLAISGRRWRSFEGGVLWSCVIVGLISFYVQGHGPAYHRYTFEAFLLTIVGIDLTSFFRWSQEQSIPGRSRAGLIASLVGVFFVGGTSLSHALHQDWHHDEFNTLLQADLNALGGHRLSEHVQCLDMSDGCIPTLYEMHLVQATGYMYDCYMLSADLSPKELQHFRQRFLPIFKAAQPSVLIVSSQDCKGFNSSYTYDKLRRWPEFASYLQQHYKLYVERIPPHTVMWGSGPSKPFGYRIYTLTQDHPAPPPEPAGHIIEPSPGRESSE